MNTEFETSVPTSARSQCSMSGDSQEKVVHHPMPPLQRTRVKRPDASEELGHAVRLAPPRTNQSLQSMDVALGALVMVCIFLAVIVWWRLLA